MRLKFSYVCCSNNKQVVISNGCNLVYSIKLSIICIFDKNQVNLLLHY